MLSKVSLIYVCYKTNSLFKSLDDDPKDNDIIVSNKQSYFLIDFLLPSLY